MGLGGTSERGGGPEPQLRSGASAAWNGAAVTRGRPRSSTGASSPFGSGPELPDAEQEQDDQQEQRSAEQPTQDEDHLFSPLSDAVGRAVDARRHAAGDPHRLARAHPATDDAAHQAD